MSNSVDGPKILMGGVRGALKALQYTVQQDEFLKTLPADIVEYIFEHKYIVHTFWNGPSAIILFISKVKSLDNDKCRHCCESP